MAKNKQATNNTQQSGTYSHQQQAVQRPDVGVQPEFDARRPASKYRYDSSLAPELCWDENAEREMTEWLLSLVAEAVERGEQAVFSNPQVWQGTGDTFHSIAECVARLKSLTQPFLNWAGKAERQQISVPTIPLFVHERHSTQAILETLDSYKASGTTLDLFGDPALDVTDKLDAYEHKGPWTNRLILGDSLQVMNSLLEYEGLGGQVQMIYMDPPYGVKFGSNFQPFVRKRDVKHGKDEEMIREPEMVKAYRDTWELGLHSYLTYLRDRLLLARELLKESGSIFVQISDENLHHVLEVMEEVFGKDNLAGLIPFKKTSGQASTLIAGVCDYLIWFCKDKSHAKYNQIYSELGTDVDDSSYNCVELPDGSWRRLKAKELRGEAPMPEGRRFRTANLTSQGASETGSKPYTFQGKVYYPSSGTHWKPGFQGLKPLEDANRLIGIGNTLAYKRYIDDFPVVAINNMWIDTIESTFVAQKIYAVQTAQKVIQRCILMATDPGDLVLDPTCGSGTTAYVAEQWGRRWITCDTSRVPLALARQRLLTATFPWYELKEPNHGPEGGFVYKRKQNRKGEEVGGLVPRITLKSIANDEDPEMVTLVDKPEVNKKVTRVCGPFTVEATIQAAGSMLEEQHAVKEVAAAYDNPRIYLDRMIEVLRQSKTLRLPGNKSLQFEQVRPLGADFEHLHAEALEQNGEERRIAVMFGPQDGAIDSGTVLEAAREAWYNKFDALYFFGFAIQAKARELIENRGKLKLPCTYVSVTPDVVMSDLLKTSKSSEIFSITGLPDVALKDTSEKSPNGAPLYQVELLGLDIFRPHDMETESIHADNLPCWMLDTDYNGMVFIARQVFFPKTSAWDNLQKSLKARFDDAVWDHLAGTISEPFVLGENKRIAVKVIDERGNELMVVREAEEAQP
jgi:adenine-specific DNA-methyltransferase